MWRRILFALGNFSRPLKRVMVNLQEFLFLVAILGVEIEVKYTWVKYNKGKLHVEVLRSERRSIGHRNSGYNYLKLDP